MKTKYKVVLTIALVGLIIYVQFNPAPQPYKTGKDAPEWAQWEWPPKPDSSFGWIWPVRQDTTKQDSTK